MKQKCYILIPSIIIPDCYIIISRANHNCILCHTLSYLVLMDHWLCACIYANGLTRRRHKKLYCIYIGGGGGACYVRYYCVLCTLLQYYTTESMVPKILAGLYSPSVPPPLVPTPICNTVQ